MYSVHVSQSVHFSRKNVYSIQLLLRGVCNPPKDENNWLEYINLLFFKSFIVIKDRKSIHSCKHMQYRASGLFKTS